MDGDRKTRFFHRIAKIKETTKRISILKVEGVFLTDQNQIIDHVVAYYKDLVNKFSILQDDHLIEEVIPLMMTG